MSGVPAICVSLLTIACINDTWKGVVEKLRYTKRIKLIVSHNGKDKHNARIDYKIALSHAQPTTFASAPFSPFSKDFC